jgi:hypothetical protein
LQLLDRVFIRLGMAETDDQLQVKYQKNTMLWIRIRNPRGSVGVDLAPMDPDPY